MEDLGNMLCRDEVVVPVIKKKEACGTSIAKLGSHLFGLQVLEQNPELPSVPLEYFRLVTDDRHRSLKIVLRASGQTFGLFGKERGTRKDGKKTRSPSDSILHHSCPWRKSIPITTSAATLIQLIAEFLHLASKILDHFVKFTDFRLEVTSTFRLSMLTLVVPFSLLMQIALDLFGLLAQFVCLIAHSCSIEVLRRDSKMMHANFGLFVMRTRLWSPHFLRTCHRHLVWHDTRSHWSHDNRTASLQTATLRASLSVEFLELFLDFPSQLRILLPVCLSQLFVKLTDLTKCLRGGATLGAFFPFSRFSAWLGLFLFRCFFLSLDSPFGRLGSFLFLCGFRLLVFLGPGNGIRNRKCEETESEQERERESFHSECMSIAKKISFGQWVSRCCHRPSLMME
jgi:hypothetical protein